MSHMPSRKQRRRASPCTTSASGPCGSTPCPPCSVIGVPSGSAGWRNYPAYWPTFIANWSPCDGTSGSGPGVEDHGRNDSGGTTRFPPLGVVSGGARVETHAGERTRGEDERRILLDRNRYRIVPQSISAADTGDAHRAHGLR